jgi:hypothetical protein
MGAGLADRAAREGGRLSTPDPRDEEQEAEATPAFRRTLVRVMLVQVVTLVLLFLLQLHYTAR